MPCFGDSGEHIWTECKEGKISRMLAKQLLAPADMGALGNYFILFLKNSKEKMEQRNLWTIPYHWKH